MKKREIYYDLIRILAIFLVIFNHLPGYYSYRNLEGIERFISVILTMFTRINVPLFFMVSGALLLRKTEDFRTVFAKRIKRFILVIIIFETGLYIEQYILNNIRYNGCDFTLEKLILGIFAGDLEGMIPYWYLYAYLGLLLTLPFLQKIAQKMNKEEFWVLIGLHFIIYTIIPLINYTLKGLNINSIILNKNLSIPFVTTKCFFYPLIGFYIDKNIDIQKISKNKSIKIVLLIFLAILIPSLCTYIQGMSEGIFTQDYVQLLDYVIAILIFILIKWIIEVSITKNRKEKITPIITKCGELVFGIYLLEPYIRKWLYGNYESLLEHQISTIIISLGWCIISMVIGGIFTYILKKIPIFRRIL